MAIRTTDDEVLDQDGNRTVAAGADRDRLVVEDRPAARRESVVEEQVVHSSASSWNLARGWVRSLGAVILVALAIVESLLAFRLAFLLAEANPSNGFVNFIYDITKPLVEPFQGIVSNSGNLEFASVIAMAVYAAGALLLIAALFALTSGPSAPPEQVVTSRTQQSEREVL